MRVRVRVYVRVYLHARACVQMVLPVTTGVISQLTIDRAKMLAGLSTEMLATDLAEYLVRKVCLACAAAAHARTRTQTPARIWQGVPFRETHHVAGAAVRLAEERGCSLANLALSDFQVSQPSLICSSRGARYRRHTCAAGTGLTPCHITPGLGAAVQALHAAFTDDVALVWNFEQSIERRCAAGGTAKVRSLPRS